MIKNKNLLISFILSAFILFFVAASDIFAAEISVSLSKKTDFARIDFGPVSSPAYTVVWGGDVLYEGTKIGEFSATLTKINYGSSGSIINYDFMIPKGETIPEFISARTNRVTSGVSADKGVIYATSPAFTFFIGAAIYMNGDNVTIIY